MGDEENVTSNPEREEEENRVPHAIQLRNDVKAAVSDAHASGEVRRRIVEALTEAEIANRTTKLTKAFGKRDEMANTLNTLRPDVITYHEDGSKATETYSKDQMEKKKKTKEELTKLDRAIAKAVDRADYGDLQKFVGG